MILLAQILPGVMSYILQPDNPTNLVFAYACLRCQGILWNDQCGDRPIYRHASKLLQETT